ncbi:ATP-binding protein [Companilactobacillus zhongbaensis]|uniref:ATP-binding protein n=1 Tax=Companilactobacillus zhongbaensis TaxID=2486009 RepID=UPI0013DE4CB2|nr:AAA family ATPase [Companilactobacillus zhongbaensis]
MKLIRVKIYGFGKWVDQEFLVDRDYQIIVGNNEAGKTTFLTFIKSILFGFASGRGSKKFEQYRPKQASSYGGELEFVDQDDNHWIVRRIDGKGDGDVTLFRNDQEVPEALLSNITGDFTKDDYEQTHVFNDETIRTLYDLNEEKLETEIMSLGAAGSKRWLETADDLQKDSGDIYKSRGMKQPLVQNIKKYQQLQQEKASFKNQQQQYIELNEELQSVDRQLSTAQQTGDALTKQQQEQKRLVEKIPKYQELMQLRSQNLTNETLISNDDWDSFLQLDQQIKTLQTSNQQQAANQVSADEQSLVDNYYSNQADIDFISQRQNDIQSNLFAIDHLNDSLRKSDFKTDKLHQENPDLTDQMTQMNDSEVKQLQTQLPKSKRAYYVGIIIILLLLLFVVPSSVMKVIPILGILVLGFGYFDIKKTNEQIKNIQQTNLEILEKHQLQSLSIERAISIQPMINELAENKQEQHDLELQISQKSSELKKWIDLGKKVGVLSQNVTPKDLIIEMTNYYSKLNKIQTKQELIQQDNLRRSQVMKSSEQNLQQLDQQMKALLAKYRVSNIENLTQLHEQQQANINAINQLKADQEFIGTDIGLLEQVTDFDQFQTDLQKLTEQIKENSQQVNELLTRKGYLESQLKQVFVDDAYQKVENDLLQTKADIIEQYDQWLANKLASDWIRKMLDQASENRYPKMLANAKKYFLTLTNGNYIDINMDKTNSLILVRADKVKFDVHEISKATRIQLYLALRLSFVVEINSIVDLPILIDDAFVDFDETRLKNIYQLIEDISKDNQILFVTTKVDENMSMQHVLSLEGK